MRRIQQIVKDLRDFARLDESDLHEVDLNAGIQSTVSQAVVMAAVVLVILPTLIGFFLLQKYIYAGITNGSVKG